MIGREFCMNTFWKAVEIFKDTPDWVTLALLPALTLVAAVLFTLFGKRKLYFPVAGVLWGVGACLAFCQAYALSRDTAAFAYAGLYFALSAALTLLFLCPRVKLKKKAKKSKADELYEKFHEELTEKPFTLQEKRPPKVCCFEEGLGGATAEESGARLAYADTLIERLRSEKLSAGDRLETEELARTLVRLRSKPLTEAEINSLNDCLASVLKMTAKYKL